MAYSMGESHAGYTSPTKYARYRTHRQASEADFDAQVASQQAIYNAEVEQSLSRYRNQRKLTTKISSLPATKTAAPPFVEQRSYSVDQGTNHHRSGSINQRATIPEQQETLRKLSDQVQQSQQSLQARLEEEVHRRQFLADPNFAIQEEGRLQVAGIAGNVPYHSPADIPIVYDSPSRDRQMSHGLPSNPRPDPYRKQPIARKESSLPQHQSPAPPAPTTSDLPLRSYQLQRQISAPRSQSPALRSRESSQNRAAEHQRKENAIIQEESVDPWSEQLKEFRMRSHERNDISASCNQHQPSISRQASENLVRTLQRKESSTSNYSTYDSRSRQASEDRHRQLSRKESSSSSRGVPLEYNMQRSLSHGNHFDAPKSAINGGTRTVKVMCDQISLTISFKPTTIVADMLSLAREQLGEGFDQKRYIMVESFKQLGSERPLRHYERVRNVLNSWDSDEQNVLLIKPFHAQWEYESLDLHNAPKLVPSDMTTSLYYSHRPESWHKWIFTLKADGQITMQKYKGGEAKTICHMNDYDIYVPTSIQMKKLSPPRKFCFAIKSQQKSAQFENTSNFVHFFSVSDKEVASEWYRAVHGWRSYYMVNSMGLGKEPMIPIGKPSISKPSFSAASHRNPSFNLRKASADKPLPPVGLTAPVMTRSESLPFNERGGPPNAYDRHAVSNHTRSGSLDRATRNGSYSATAPGPFAPNSLLGQSYTQRKESLNSKPDISLDTNLPTHLRLLRNDSAAMFASPFQEDSLLGKAYPQRKESANVTSAIAASPAHPHSYGRPSIDQGRAQDHQHPANAAATAAPRDWKFDPYTGKPISSNHHKRSESLSGSNSQRSRQNSQEEIERGRSRTATRKMSNEAFTGKVPAAQEKAGQGSYGGREARKASRDTQWPMVDLSLHSEFTPGSLLSSLEQKQSQLNIGPIIQREKVYEITTVTGERFF